MTSPLLAVWFLDSRGLIEQKKEGFLRFWTTYSTQPSLGNNLSSRFDGNKQHIGWVALAEVSDTNEIHIETVWGKRFGRASRITVDKHGQVVTKDVLWVS